MPVQSRMPVPAAAEEALGELASRAAALAAASGGNLLECFAAVPDPRDPRGIRHSLPCVLALCTAAVLCGNTAVEDVTAWVHAAPQEVLAAAGARRNALGARVAPHPDTVVRVLHRAGRAGRRAIMPGRTWPAARTPARSRFPWPGRAGCPRSRWTARRSAARPGGDGLIPYLLAAVIHGTGTVLAERLIGPKTNEVPGVRAAAAGAERVLPPGRARHHRRRRPHRQGPRHVHLRGAPGALRLHGQAEHARRCGTELDALDWASVPVRHVDRGERPRAARAPHHPGHGRPRAHHAGGSRTPARSP